MSIKLRVSGNEYSNFLSGEVEIRLDVLCNTFSFVLASNNQPLPFRVGDKCEVLINDVLVLTGSIEVLTINYSSRSHTIEIAGRDNTSDLLDSSIDELFSDLEQGPTLKTLLVEIIDHIKSELSVVDNSGGVRFNPADDVASPESGDNAFEFAEKLARQKQVLLTSNGAGNIVITRGSSSRLSGARVQNLIKKNQDNNVLSSSASYDNTGRYNLYALTGFGNPSALADDGDADLDSIVSRGGRIFDGEIRAGRQLVLSSESTFNDGDHFDRARWELNIRKARGRLYTAVVFGYSISGKIDGSDIWEINKLVKVVDEFAGISDDMLINSVKFGLDTQEGSRTSITFVEPNSYSLDLEEAASGEGFI